MARDSGLVGQLRVIARAVEVLPEVRDHLVKLDEHVTEMSAEVTRMRKGVDALGEQVGTLNAGVGDLDVHFVGLRDDMAGLDRHFRALRGTLAPIGNALAGVGKLGVRIRGNLTPRPDVGRMPRGKFTLFHVRGIRIGADYSWFIVLLLVICLALGPYRDVLGGHDSLEPYVLAVVSALLFFGSILLHELGHAFVALRKGIEISDITLWMFGGLARLKRDSDTPGTGVQDRARRARPSPS